MNRNFTILTSYNLELLSIKDRGIIRKMGGKVIDFHLVAMVAVS